MFRSLVALLLAFVLTFAGITTPAYAEGNQVSGLSLGAKQIADSHNITDSHDTITVNLPALPLSPTPSAWDNFAEGILNGAAQATGLVIGGATVCYALNGAAATVFPPAAALLPYCPAIGATLGSGNTVKNAVQAVAKAL